MPSIISILRKGEDASGLSRLSCYPPLPKGADLKGQVIRVGHSLLHWIPLGLLTKKFTALFSFWYHPGIGDPQTHPFQMLALGGPAQQWMNHAQKTTFKSFSACLLVWVSFCCCSKLQYKGSKTMQMYNPVVLDGEKDQGCGRQACVPAPGSLWRLQGGLFPRLLLCLKVPSFLASRPLPCSAWICASVVMSRVTLRSASHGTLGLPWALPDNLGPAPPSLDL